MPFSLRDVPDELVRHILLYVPPEDTLGSIQLLSRRFYHIANEPLLWRWHCQRSFRYWAPDHKFREKLAAIASSVDWKGLWITRKRRNLRAAHLLDGVISTKRGQLKRLKGICELGLDVKDYLLEQGRVDESAEDVLARRYYANTALDSIHRGMAVDVWSRYQGHPLSPHRLDLALGAFDMFVLHDQEQDLDYIVRTLDALTKRFKAEHPTYGDMSTRERALALARWLRANNLTGMDHPEINYRNLRNCFLGHALSDENHPSLPIISSAIFVCIAERLGMTAFCLAFPSHVHAAVFAPPGVDLDGNETEDDAPDGENRRMCLDPYGSDEEVTLSDLRRRLVEFGWTQGTEAFLRPSPVTMIVQRTAQNIGATYGTVRSLTDNDVLGAEMARLRRGYPGLNLDAALYAAMWAELLMKQVSGHWSWNLVRFLQKFALRWSEDMWIVERYLVPLYDEFVALRNNPQPPVGYENVREILAMLENLDNRVPEVSRRYTEDITSRVRYRIGQVFRHRRYGYIGVINGWAAMGSASLPMPHFLNAAEADEEGDVFDPTESVHASMLAPQRTYYTCLKSTVDRLRVAQDNVVIVTDPDLIPEELFFMAGKFFRRFDRETCTFVSNIREYYPDD